MLVSIEAFETWCTVQGVEPFPAQVSTVCRFVEDQGKTKAPPTMQRRLYAIRKVHRRLRLPDPTYDVDINLTFRRIRRTKPNRPKPAKRPYS